MPATKARHSYGATLGIDPAGGTSYTTVAEVKDIDQKGLKVTTSEATNLSSPSAYKEKVPGLVDAGQLTCKLNFTETQFALFLTMIRKTLMSFEITYPMQGTQTVAATLKGTGQIGDIGHVIPEDGVITCDATFEASGPWTFTPGTPEV